MATSRRKDVFPWKQMIILSIARFAEPVASTSVNPYIPDMVAGFNIPTDKIGMYSGWLAAVFSLSQATTGVAWGRASDRYGRKPMILLALLATMISCVLFGFSTSLLMAFITRSMQGVSNGNVGIIRTAVAEMVPQKELQPRAFSVMPLVWSVGSMFGPSIGGFLSNPQQHGWFKNSDLFRKYPYAFPNLMISLLFLVGITIATLFLEESHADKKHRKDYGLILGSALTSSCSKRKERSWTPDGEESNPFLGESGHSRMNSVTAESSRSKVKQARRDSWRDVFSYQSQVNLVAYTGLAMHSMAFDQLIPVFMHHPVQPHDSAQFKPPWKFAGGFGLHSGRIGVLLTVFATYGILVQVLLFPPVVRKFGTLFCFKVCAVTFPFVYTAVPFTSLLPTSGQREGICLLLMLAKCTVAIFAFPCSTIMLTNSASSLSLLGTLNGVATSISAVGRAAGPALMGWAFTLGVEKGYLVIPFWTLSVVSIISAFPVWWLVEMDGPSGNAAGTADYEDEEGIPLDLADDEQRLRRGSDQAEVARKTAKFGILAGTEEADLVEDDLLVVHQADYSKTK